jgi:hypothetical protein
MFTATRRASSFESASFVASRFHEVAIGHCFAGGVVHAIRPRKFFDGPGRRYGRTGGTMAFLLGVVAVLAA